jgi:hypothetical protein
MLIYEQNHLVCSWCLVYLTPAPRIWCWCRGVASVLICWLICLPCSTWWAPEAWLDSVVLWSRLNSEAVLSVLAVLGVLGVLDILGDLPVQFCRWMNQVTRVWLWKAFIWPAMASLVDSTTTYHGDSLCVCYTCTLPCVLPGCVCVQVLCTWAWFYLWHGSARQRLQHIHFISFVC